MNAQGLSIQSLSLCYQARGQRTVALSEVSLDIPKGKICALVGASGSGKSSLLSVLSGIQQAHEGTVLLGGEELNPQRHQVALVPQSYGLLPWKTIRANILLPKQLGKRFVSEGELSEILEALGLSSQLLCRYPHELSGGQRQRVALARAFGMRPDLLLLDEPFSALDVITAERGRELFARLWSRYPTTTLLVSHSPSEVTALASEVFVLSGGRIVQRLSSPEESAVSLALKQSYTDE